MLIYIAKFMQLFEIVTGDLRAHGQSSRIPAPYTPLPGYFYYNLQCTQPETLFNSQ